MTKVPEFDALSDAHQSQTMTSAEEDDSVPPLPHLSSALGATTRIVPDRPATALRRNGQVALTVLRPSTTAGGERPGRAGGRGGNAGGGGALTPSSRSNAAASALPISQRAQTAPAGMKRSPGGGTNSVAATAAQGGARAGLGSRAQQRQRGKAAVAGEGTETAGSNGSAAPHQASAAIPVQQGSPEAGAAEPGGEPASREGGGSLPPASAPGAPQPMSLKVCIGPKRPRQVWKKLV